MGAVLRNAAGCNTFTRPYRRVMHNHSDNPEY
jgi:hypothetical protein